MECPWLSDIPKAADSVEQNSLSEGYRRMAADLDREREAEEWIKQLLFDME